MSVLKWIMTFFSRPMFKLQSYPPRTQGSISRASTPVAILKYSLRNAFRALLLCLKSTEMISDRSKLGQIDATTQRYLNQCDAMRISRMRNLSGACGILKIIIVEASASCQKWKHFHKTHEHKSLLITGERAHKAPYA